MVKAIVGANWGDEGKGKITDLLAETSDVVIRFQGGANAGHTIKTAQGETILHLVPSGILFPDTLCIIGNGVVLDADVFLQEIDDLAQKGIDISPKRLCISKKNPSRAPLLTRLWTRPGRPEGPLTKSAPQGAALAPPMKTRPPERG